MMMIVVIVIVESGYRDSLDVAQFAIVFPFWDIIYHSLYESELSYLANRQFS